MKTKVAAATVLIAVAPSLAAATIPLAKGIGMKTSQAKDRRSGKKCRRAAKRGGRRQKDEISTEGFIESIEQYVGVTREWCAEEAGELEME